MRLTIVTSAERERVRRVRMGSRRLRVFVRGDIFFFGSFCFFM